MEDISEIARESLPSSIQLNIGTLFSDSETPLLEMKSTPSNVMQLIKQGYYKIEKMVDRHERDRI